MPVIDWTNPTFVLTLAVLGIILIVLGIVLAFRSAVRSKGLALAVGIVGGLAAGTALGLHLLPIAPAEDRGQPLASPPPEPSAPAAPAPILVHQETLDRFHKATPAERMTLLARLPDHAAAWYTVQRGDVDTLVERGTVESADKGEVVVKVHGRQPGKAVGTITWIVDNGAMVKKGQLLVTLDDAELKERLKAQQIVVLHAKNDLTRSQKEKEIDNEETPLDIKQARLEVALAERALDTYTGDDALEKRGRELQVEQARLKLKTRESRAITKKAAQETDLMIFRATLDLEMARLHDIEKDIANCKMVAPRDGQVIYYVPERWRGPGSPWGWQAEGERVAEGQIVLSIPDLSKMRVFVRIPESQRTLVHLDQAASVRLNAFPGRAFAGKVVKIDKVRAWGPKQRFYSVAIALADEKLGLKPGMSAEVRLPVEPRRNVPRVPAQALIGEGQKAVCFVKSGAEIQERPVSTGLRDKEFVEIKEGVKEGEQVLRDPRAILQRVSQPRRAEDVDDKQGARE